MSYNYVLSHCNVSSTVYQDLLKFSSDSTTVYMKRSINNYNQWLLKAWHVNMDLQFLSNAYACIQYTTLDYTGRSWDGDTAASSCERGC